MPCAYVCGVLRSVSPRYLSPCSVSCAFHELRSSDGDQDAHRTPPFAKVTQVVSGRTGV